MSDTLELEKVGHSLDTISLFKSSRGWAKPISTTSNHTDWYLIDALHREWITQELVREFPVLNEGLLLLDQVVLHDMLIFFDWFCATRPLFSLVTVALRTIITDSLNILLPVGSIVCIDAKLSLPSNAIHRCF